jgi:hypothetical protein
MDHDLKDFLKLHARAGAATGPLCARALNRIEVLEAALTPFACSVSEPKTMTRQCCAGRTSITLALR